MQFAERRLRAILKLLALGMVGGLLVTLRYILKTPQPLESVLPGDGRIYRWTHGHVFYKVYGAADAPPLLLLHTPEIGASSYEMRHIMPALAQYYRVYALDLPGFGLSDRPDIDYSANVYVALCRNFLIDVVAEPAVLCASGLSCSYCVALAVSNPELCQRLVLLSPSSLFAPPRMRPWLWRLAQYSLLELFLYALVTPRVVLRWVLTRKHAGRGLLPEEIDYYFASAHQLGAQHAALAFLAGRLICPMPQQLGKVQQPALIMWGGKETERALSDQRSSDNLQQVVLDDESVCVHEESPTKVVSTLLQWQRGELESWTSVASTVPSNSIPGAQTPVEDKVPSEVANSLLEPSSAKTADATASQESGAMPEGEHPENAVEAYCVKCRQKRIMPHPKKIVTKNGRHALEDTCPVCGTRLFRFVAGA